MPEPDDDALLRAKLNLETARIGWKALEHLFAAGSVLVVRPGDDLVEVATQMARDNREAVAGWLADGTLAQVGDAQALAWHQAEAELWAVVVKPFVLVQQSA
ncbi:MAG TPA: DUF2288 domain-containing protein [Gammaproteobacteria bacterium]